MKYYVSVFLLLFSTHGFSSGEDYREWDVGNVMSRGVAISYANTTNESGSTLGVLCLSSSKACIPYLINGLTCTSEHHYSGLVAVNGQIKSVKMECFHIEDQNVLLLPEKHIRLMLKSQDYSVAFGTAEGKFRAVYFGLEGFEKAMEAARNAVDYSRLKMPKNSDQKVFKDENL